MKTVHLDPAMVPVELRGGFGGKRFKAVITDCVTIPAYAGMWSGGARETWDLITLDGRKRLTNGDAAFHGLQPQQKIELVPGILIRRCYESVGYSQLTFYIHPETATKLLPPPAPELTPFEREVLRATKCYKSYYAGKDRYQMSQDEILFEGSNGRNKVPQMTRQQWENAKELLISKKLLNKSGAITVAGRNAIEKQT